MTSPDLPPAHPPSTEPDIPAADAVWTYRGYKLRASEFTTAMVHLFRAEVQRANVWRQRLDTTTNWAVITTGAVLSFAFTQQQINHIVILLNIILVTIFLLTEARRYRYYELWSYRIRLMETDFFAAMLVPPFHPSPDWAEALSEALLHPQFPITNWEAIGRRLRRNYLWIYGVISTAWLARLWLFPTTAQTFRVLLARAAVGGVPGAWVIAGYVLFVLALIILGLGTVRLQAAAGEVLPRYQTGDTISTKDTLLEEDRGKTAWFRPSHRRPQLLTLIITDQPVEVSNTILRQMRRGVTALDGTGMYTGQPHKVLMCALTVTEVAHLKSLVAQVDTKAFVIVTPAQEIFGLGFVPLEADKERPGDKGRPADKGHARAAEKKTGQKRGKQ